MNEQRYNVFFLGIGGIGMSALARFYMHEGYSVAGYDRTSTPLTRALEQEGAQVHYQDAVSNIPAAFAGADTFVVWTPAIPADSPELNYFRTNGNKMLKRSQALGHIAENKFVMAVAGTHGKTTTTTLTAWLNHRAGLDKGIIGCGSAFLGGISKNFNSNLVLGRGDRLAVEADEYDRSFLTLYPDIAVITAADPDHLDIYGTHEAVKQAFGQFISQIKPGGALILKLGVDVPLNNKKITVYRYSMDRPCDFHAKNIVLQSGGHYTFDLVTPTGTIQNCTLGIPGLINIENAVAAAAMLFIAGADENALKQALAEFSGVRRRFDFYINTPQKVYMDDYAHHPEELRAAIGSLKAMFPDRKLTAIFQPHLYTRTQDLYREFAEVLSMADHVILLPIYPAREEPIPGVDSELIGKHMTAPWEIVPKERIAERIGRIPTDVVATFGAGDIENYCQPIAETLKNKE